MSVAELQLINKVLTDGDYSIIEENSITKEHLPQVSKEFDYISDFYKQYKAVPDKLAFSEKFPEFEYIAVNQPTRSIIDELREQCLFRRAVSVINESSTIFEKNANKGAEFLLSQLDYLQPTYELGCVDIIHDTSRLESYKQRLSNGQRNFIPLPFDELNRELYGYQRGEELFLWLALSGLGKSQCLVMSMERASREGYRVGCYSPELSTERIGLRYDSARGHISNTALNKGLLIPNYEEYYKNMLDSDEHVFVLDNENLSGGMITVQQCINFVKSMKLDILFIDGIVYVKPIGWHNRMTQAETMGLVGRQLFQLSKEYKIPVVCAVQARRRSNEKRTEEETISDSQSVFGSFELTQAATRIVSINRSASALKFCNVKSRYTKEGNSWLYNYDFDRMTMTYIPDIEDIKQDKELEELVKESKKEFKYAF